MRGGIRSTSRTIRPVPLDKNRHSDANQHQRYLERLGAKNIPKSLDDFQNLKYTEPEKWDKLKTAFRSKNGLQQQLSYVHNQ